MPHGSLGGSRRRSVGGSPAPAAYLGSPPSSSPPRVCRGHHAPEWGSRAAACRSSPRTVCWCWRLQPAARPLGRQMLVSLPPRIVDPPTAAHLHFFGICASYIAALHSSLTCQNCLRDLFVFPLPGTGKIMGL
jgi:hypothetical protein